MRTLLCDGYPPPPCAAPRPPCRCEPVVFSPSSIKAVLPFVGFWLSADSFGGCTLLPLYMVPVTGGPSVSGFCAAAITRTADKAASEIFPIIACPHLPQLSGPLSPSARYRPPLRRNRRCCRASAPRSAHS